MLIEKLKGIQTREGLSDTQFAKNIGIHRVSWQRIKNRRKPFGIKFLRFVRKAYPELKNDIDIFLSGKITSVYSTEACCSDDAQSHYNQNPGGLWDSLKGFIGKITNYRF